MKQWLALLFFACCGLLEADAEKLEEALDEGRSLVVERRFAEAVRTFESLLKDEPNSAEGWAGLGEAYYGLGKTTMARKALLNSLKLDPDQPKLRLFLQNHLPEDTEDEALSASGSASWFQPLWRSALLPGWGQVYNGQSRKGFWLGVGTLAFLGGAAASYAAADNAYKEYMNLGLGTRQEEFTSAYNRVEALAMANHVLAILFYAAYAYNLGDAAAGARKRAQLGMDAKGRLYASLPF